MHKEHSCILASTQIATVATVRSTSSTALQQLLYVTEPTPHFFYVFLLKLLVYNASLVMTNAQIPSHLRQQKGQGPDPTISSAK